MFKKITIISLMVLHGLIVPSHTYYVPVKQTNSSILRKKNSREKLEAARVGRSNSSTEPKSINILSSNEDTIYGNRETNSDGEQSLKSPLIDWEERFQNPRSPTFEKKQRESSRNSQKVSSKLDKEKGLPNNPSNITLDDEQSLKSPSIDWGSNFNITLSPIFEEEQKESSNKWSSQDELDFNNRPFIWADKESFPKIDVFKTKERRQVRPRLSLSDAKKSSEELTLLQDKVNKKREANASPKEKELSLGVEVPTVYSIEGEILE